MQIVIDIPEEDYNFIKDLEFYTSGRRSGRAIEQNVINAIRNGTPCNPPGDLISRESLKKALKSNCTPELCHDINTAWCDRCCRTHEFEDLIDEAPTVEAFTPEQVKELVDLNRKLSEERPAGEWVRKVDVIQSIAKQYSEHNELVPMWLSIGNIKGGAENG